MATVTDADACTAADAGERAALPVITVTGLHVTDGAGDPAQGLVVFDAGQLEAAPGIGGAAGVFGNPVVTQVYNGAMLPVTLPDSAIAFAAPFSYVITLKLEGFTDLVFSAITLSRARFPSGACDLSQLV